MNSPFDGPEPFDMTATRDQDGFGDMFPSTHANSSGNFDSMNLDQFGDAQVLSPFSAGFSFNASPSLTYSDPKQFYESIDPRQTTMESNHTKKHGLITPPHSKDDDLEDDRLSPKIELPQEVEQQKDTERNESKQETSRRRRQQAESTASRRTRMASVSSVSSRGATQTKKQSARTSTRKARKGYKATTKEEENDPEGEEKRVKFLERNRVAASKCRDKKKVWVTQLEGKLREGQTKHAALVDAVTNLQSELVQLKEEALKHFDCDANIRDWLVSRVGQPQENAFAPPPAAPGRQRDSGYGSMLNTSAYNYPTSSSALGAKASDQMSRRQSSPHSVGGTDHAMSRTSSGIGQSPSSDAADSEFRAMLEASIAEPGSASPSGG